MNKKLEKLDIFLLIILSIMALLILYPFYNGLVISLVSQKEYLKNPFMLWPKEITLKSYQFIFATPRILNGYKVTIFITVIGVIYSMIITVPLSYAMSKKFPGRNIFINLIIFTMYFQGGLIPFYLLVKNIGLIDSVWALIWPIGVNTFNFLITRNYFQTIPPSLEEAARIEGANDLYILSRIIIPLSMPVLVVIALFYGVTSWNEWFNSMLFIKNPENQSLQFALRQIIQTMDNIRKEAVALQLPEFLTKNQFSDGIKMAATFIVMVPIMCVYPFVQKYFVKGIMVGAIKS